jgi:hypothetical protein
MRPINVTLGNLAAASANNIALSQSLGGAGPVTLNGSTSVGGVAVLDQARQVLITSAGNDSGITFIVTGLNRWNQIISETIAGGNVAAVATTNVFATVTKIVSSAATAAAITVGTNGVTSIMIPVDWEANPTNIGLNAVVTGTVNYTINQTWDNPYTTTGLYPANWTAISALSAKTATAQVNLTNDFTALQLVINSGTGSLLLEVVQAGTPAFIEGFGASSGGGGGLGSYLAYASPAGASNNVNPAGFGSTVGLLNVTLAAGDANWTGLMAGADKQLLTIANADTVHTLTLNGLNAGSLPANQFRAGGDPVLPPLSTLLLCYYTTPAQWIVV